MTEMDKWTIKYKPTRLEDVIGDRENIDKINNFIKQFNVENFDPMLITNPNLIIHGSNGVGKTLITDLAILENNFEKITADLSKISVERKSKKKKNDKEFVPTGRTINTYYMTLKNNKKMLPNGEYYYKKNILVFDDVSSMSNPKEKDALKALIKTNNKYKEFPIIIIANTKHSKIVNELKKMVSYVIKTNTNGKKESHKYTNEVFINPPNFDCIKQFIQKICVAEKINLVSPKHGINNIYQDIYDHAQNDVYRLINILEELYLIYRDTPIDTEKFETYIITSSKKDLDPGIFESTGNLLTSFLGIDQILHIYSEERAATPLMVHENYPLNIRNQYPKLSAVEQIDMLYNISKSISESDRVDGLIYSNQCWNLQPVHGFYSCVLPSYYINSLPGKQSKYEKYRYTQDYNKTSIKKINNKVIKKAQEHPFFKKVSIYDFLFIASILKTLFEKKDFETVTKLIKPYGLKLKEIESIIKIDKIKKSKAALLTGKQRNILKEMLDVDE
jgi:hypothetical protein